MTWLEDYPQEKGNYLWVSVWGCDCCVRKSGIAWIYDVKDYHADEMPSINYHTQEGKHLGISWEGAEPDFCEGKPDIDGWLYLPTLPRLKPLNCFITTASMKTCSANLNWVAFPLRNVCLSTRS